MPTYGLSQYEQRQYFDDNGDPLAGGFVFTYLSGTSTPATTYSDSIGTPNANPVVLSAAGRCRIFLQPIAYKFILTDANLVPVGLTMDPVTASASAVGVNAGLGEAFTFEGNSQAAVTLAAYPSGATFDMLHPGTAVLLEDSNNLVGTYVLRATGVVDGGTLTVAVVNLSDGAPDTPLATLTITSTTGEVSTSGVITFGAAGIAKRYGIKTKMTGVNTGFAWGIVLVRTA